MNCKLLRFVMFTLSLPLLGPALAKAQVNGSGPSDSALFDTVINVPDDQDSISGGVGNASGVAVPTTQLNVRDGGAVDSMANFFNANSGSEVNISGGTVDDVFVFNAESGSMVNLMGTEFLLDGVLLDSLVAGEAFTINDRDVTLSGLLADGTPFEFDLNSTTNFFEDSFAPDATLTVTLSGGLLGDVNKDGVVDFLDISPFISLLATGEFQDEADIDSSGTVDFLDISPFILLLSN